MPIARFNLKRQAAFCYNRRMDTSPGVSPFTKIVVLGMFLSAAAGCARFPEGQTVKVVKELSIEIVFNGSINDDFFYFMPIDIEGGGTGPTPLFPGGTPGQPWVTGSATHYVQFHQGQYTLHRILSLDPFQFQPIGAPISSTPPQDGTLSFTIDLDDLGITADSIDINFIAVDFPFEQTRVLDALGPAGTQILNVDVTIDRTITNTDLGDLEIPDDLLDENGNREPTSDRTRPLDIVDWSVTVDI